MNGEIRAINEIKDSQILFDQKPPLFGRIFVLIVTIFLTISVIWSIRTPKPYIIKAQGIVTDNNSNYVMCVYTGEIEECYLKEGDLVEKGDVLLTIKSIEYDLQEKQLKDNRSVYEKQIEKNEMLVKSIKNDTNYFSDTDSEDELYYSSYETYKAQIAQTSMDASAYKTYGYTDEQIEEELKKNQGKIAEIYYTAIQSAERSIVEAKEQITSIDAQLAAITSGQLEYEVKATASGVVHLLEDYKSGMVVQTASAVASITPENSQPVIEAYVSTSDMARMHKEDDVQITVDGLIQNVYGTITGHVIQIDSNVSFQENTEGVKDRLFRILVEMDSDYLVSRSGEKVNIKNGMSTELSIVYDRVTYFEFVLEKLGFKTRK